MGVSKYQPPSPHPSPIILGGRLNPPLYTRKTAKGSPYTMWGIILKYMVNDIIFTNYILFPIYPLYIRAGVPGSLHPSREMIVGVDQLRGK